LSLSTLIAFDAHVVEWGQTATKDCLLSAYWPNM